jgi:hypothetical protein
MLTVDAGDDTAFFSKLPVEVKENIYEHALCDGRFFKVPLSITTRNEYTNLPPVCRTNKLERSIATLVLIRNSIIRIKNPLISAFSVDGWIWLMFRRPNS